MDPDKVEAAIEKICSRIGQSYTGFHTMSVGNIDGEGCPEIRFRVVDPSKPKPQELEEEDAFEEFDFFSALVGENRTIVKDEGGVTVAEYSDITKLDIL